MKEGKNMGLASLLKSILIEPDTANVGIDIDSLPEDCKDTLKRVEKREQLRKEFEEQGLENKKAIDKYKISEKIEGHVKEQTKHEKEDQERTRG